MACLQGTAAGKRRRVMGAPGTHVERRCAVFSVNATFSEVGQLQFWGRSVAAARGGAPRYWQQPVVGETYIIREEYEGVS